MKKVLVITYYWPPSGGAGVQRWLKLIKYLPEYGWTPVVFTPENPENPVEDVSLVKDIPHGLEVVKHKIWEPYRFYKKLLSIPDKEKINTGFLTESRKNSLLEDFSIWIRGNLFIPDARRFWIKPSVRFLRNYVSNNEIDAIVTTGPPHSLHLIGFQLKRILGIHWIADFRDPWTDIDYYSDLKLTNWSDRKHHRLEKKVVMNADKVVVIGETMAEQFRIRFNRDIAVVPNGFDDDDFNDIKVEKESKSFTVTHLGTLVRSRNPEKFWKALSDFSQRSGDRKIKLKLVGKVDISVTDSLTKFKNNFSLEKMSYVAHDKVPYILKSSDLLLLVINDSGNQKGILTGKIFEYIASGIPILCVGPKDGDAANVIKETGTGVVFDFEDLDGITEYLEGLYRNGPGTEPNWEVISKYSRRNQAGKIAEILETIC